MSAIAGFCNIQADYTKESGRWQQVLENMKQVLRHRGPDDEGDILYAQSGFVHTSLSIIDTDGAREPITRQKSGNHYTIVLSGEIFNIPELKENLGRMGYQLRSRSSAEVVLNCYMAFGIDFINDLNGNFAFAIWDDNLKRLLLARDRFGIIPLFYTVRDNTFVFSSEIKGLFQYPGVKPQLDKSGLTEVFAIGPAKTCGHGIFKDVHEVLPGNYILYDHYGLHENPYWRLVSHPHEDSYAATVEKTSFLLKDTVKRQMVSDRPICTLLSGGVDSSIVTAICAEELKKEGKRIDTYSFDFVDNDKNFKSNSFQPSLDRPFVDIMKEHVGSNHTYLECGNQDMINHLYDAVDARDLPNMGDIESSLLYFCKRVSEKSKVALTGECADEIFCGYPWCHNPEFMNLNTFPWSKNMETRKLLLADDVLSTLDLDGFVQAAYDNSIASVPKLVGENKEAARKREIAYLNLTWFGVTLLDRMDRASSYAGIEARVPFADHRIVEYVWNVPWEMKTPNGVVKGLLRDAGKELLPEAVQLRKKSPYPKTYHPEYEKLLGSRLLEIISDPNAPIRSLVDVNKVRTFLSAPSDYGKPWYGQLMAGPQLIAYMIQINYWLDKYKIELV